MHRAPDPGNSLKYVPRREFAAVARDLKPIYTAIDADHARQELEAFDKKWVRRFPVITQAWLRQLGIRHPVSGLRTTKSAA